MAKIDILLEKLIEEGYTRLVLEAGKVPWMERGKEKRALGTQELTNQQIITILSDGIFPNIEEEINLTRELKRTYKLRIDTFRVTVSNVAGRVWAVFERVPGKEEVGWEEKNEIDRYLKVLVEKKGSDLHITPGEPPIIRVDGDLVRLTDFPSFTPEDTERMLFGIMEERYKKEFAEHHETDFSYEIKGVARFRVNVYMERRGMGGAFRFIPYKVVTADDLKLPAAVRNLCYLTKGLVLVTGPTGSGKSTTLCALIDLINSTRHDHILTIEDPIEFIHENKKCLVTQREVGTHTKSFARALRAALREDPDVVLIGEMRDLETVKIALETAETGHLVFATLHTTTAATTVDRIIDQFPQGEQEQIRTMLASELKAVISQTLCKRKGGGRVAAMEILIVTPAVSNLIREGKTYQIPSIIQTQRQLGMISMHDALMELVRKGIIEPEEAYLRAPDKSTMYEMLTSAGYSVKLSR